MCVCGGGAGRGEAQVGHWFKKGGGGDAAGATLALKRGSAAGSTLPASLVAACPHHPWFPSALRPLLTDVKVVACRGGVQEGAAA